MLNHSKTHHCSEPCQADFWINSVVQRNDEEKITFKPVQLNLVRKDILNADREKIKRKLSFLKPYQNSIHSLVLVGSTAYNAQNSNSDIDIVIISTHGGHEKVCNFLFEKEIE
jgi:predicted nucleotidyltransferase